MQFARKQFLYASHFLLPQMLLLVLFGHPETVIFWGVTERGKGQFHTYRRPLGGSVHVLGRFVSVDLQGQDLRKGES